MINWWQIASHLLSVGIAKRCLRLKTKPGTTTNNLTGHVKRRRLGPLHEPNQVATAPVPHHHSKRQACLAVTLLLLSPSRLLKIRRLRPMTVWHACLQYRKERLGAFHPASTLKACSRPERIRRRKTAARLILRCGKWPSGTSRKREPRSRDRAVSRLLSPR